MNEGHGKWCSLYSKACEKEDYVLQNCKWWFPPSSFFTHLKLWSRQFSRYFKKSMNLHWYMTFVLIAASSAILKADAISSGTLGKKILPMHIEYSMNIGQIHLISKFIESFCDAFTSARKYYQKFEKYKIANINWC